MAEEAQTKTQAQAHRGSFYYLVFTEQILNHPRETISAWKFDLTDTELSSMSCEVTHYNSWITSLLEGRAPASSYYKLRGKDPSIALYHRKYRYVYTSTEIKYPAEDQIIGKIHGEFDLLSEDVFHEHYGPGKLSELTSTTVVDMMPAGCLEDLIQDPLDLNDSFSLGFKVLPLTKFLIETQVELNSISVGEYLDEQTPKPF